MKAEGCTLRSSRRGSVTQLVSHQPCCSCISRLHRPATLTEPPLTPRRQDRSARGNRRARAPPREQGRGVHQWHGGARGRRPGPRWGYQRWRSSPRRALHPLGYLGQGMPRPLFLSRPVADTFRCGVYSGPARAGFHGSECMRWDASRLMSGNECILGLCMNRCDRRDLKELGTGRLPPPPWKP